MWRIRNSASRAAVPHGACGIAATVSAASICFVAPHFARASRTLHSLTRDPRSTHLACASTVRAPASTGLRSTAPLCCCCCIATRSFSGSTRQHNGSDGRDSHPSAASSVALASPSPSPSPPRPTLGHQRRTPRVPNPLASLAHSRLRPLASSGADGSFLQLLRQTSASCTDAQPKAPSPLPPQPEDESEDLTGSDDPTASDAQRPHKYSIPPIYLERQMWLHLQHATAPLVTSAARRKYIGKVYTAIRMFPASFAALSPAVIQRLFVTLYMAERTPSSLIGGRPSVNPLPVERNQRIGLPLRPGGMLDSFLMMLVRETDALLERFKAAPVGATTFDGHPVPTSKEVRAAVCAFHTSMRGLGDSGVFAYLTPDPQCPNDRRRRSVLEGGNMGTGQASWNKMDPTAFPHLDVGFRIGHAPLAIAEAQEVVRKHADLFLWPPAAEAGGVDEPMSAEQVVAEAQQTQFGPRSPAATPPSASAPTVPSSYPHRSPARNVVALMQLFQPLRQVHSPTRLMDELLRVASTHSIAMLDQLRADRPKHFMDQLNQIVAERRHVAMKVAKSWATNRSSNAEGGAEAGSIGAHHNVTPSAEAAVEEELDPVAEAEAEAKEAEEADAATAGGAEDLALAAGVDAEAEANAEADAEAEAELLAAGQQPPATEAAEPTDPSSDLPFGQVPVSAPPSAPSRHRLHMRTLVGSLDQEEMLVLVESWAANNCIGVNSFFRRILHSYLNMHVNYFCHRLSLSQLHRWMLCLSCMELVLPVSQKLLTATTRFFGSHTVRKLLDTHIGVAQRVMSVPVQQLEHVRTRAHVDQLLEQLDQAQTHSQPAADQPPPQQQQQQVFSAPPASAERLPSPLRLGNVLSNMLRAYGPIAVLQTDLRRQVHLSPRELEQLTTSHSEPDSASMLIVVRALCDYLIGVMNDERIMAEHTAGYAYPSDPTLSAEHLSVLSLLKELTQVAWSLVLMQLDKYAFVQHFLAHYTRWFDTHLSLHVDGEMAVLHYHGHEISWGNPVSATANRMHQVSLQLFLLSKRARSPSLKFMPSLRIEPPPLPFELNFSSATRDALIRFTQQSSAPNVSNFQLQVYQLMRDPDGELQFRQRVLHRNLQLTMSHRIKSHMLAREAELNAAAPVAAHSPVFDASNEAEDVLLQDRMHAHDAINEHTHQHNAVDFFVEHKTALGYIIDAALFMRFKPTDSKQQQHQQPVQHEPQQAQTTDKPPDKPSAHPFSMMSLPAVRAALASIAPATTLAASSTAAAAASSSGSAAPSTSLRTMSVALEIDGVYHFCKSSPQYLRASSRLKLRQLSAFGWQTVHIPYFVWNRMSNDPDAQARWLAETMPRSLLKRVRDKQRDYAEAMERRRLERRESRPDENEERRASALRAKLAHGAKPFDRNLVAPQRRA